MPTTTLIFNPNAGNQNRLRMIRKVAAWWHGRGWNVVLKPTQYAGHAEGLAREAHERGHQMVLAAGGDGTLSEVANGLALTNTILAPLPVGTANSLAKEFEMPRPGFLRSARLIDSAESLYKGRVQTIDLLKTSSERYVLLWLGVGLDAYVVNQIEPRSKIAKRFGVLGYFLQSLFHISRRQEWQIKVSVDGQQQANDYLAVNVSNCRRFFGGELLLQPGAQWDDGEFEMLFIKGRRFWGLLKLLAQARFGRAGNNPNLTRLTGRQAAIQTTPTTIMQMDGEPSGPTPVGVQIVPQALRLLVPATAPAGLFSQAGLPFEQVSNGISTDQ